MLLVSAILATAFEAVPVEEKAQRLYCNAIIAILHDLAENCVVLVDEGNVITGKLFDAAHSWPLKYRTDVLTLLTLLRTRNRFVKIPATLYEKHEHCSQEPCKHAVGIAKSERHDVLLAGGSCPCGYAKETRLSWTVVEDYSLSAFFRERRDAAIFLLTRAQWDRSTFERRVLSPTLKYARMVKIYDRWLGNTIETRSYDGKVLTSTAVASRYRQSIEWIIQVFLRDRTRLKSPVELYSSIDTRGKDKREIAIAIAALRVFEAEIRASYALPEFSIFIKEETAKARMLHGRYLITDQIGIIVERGFDLLMSPEMMRDAGYDPASAEVRIQDSVIACCRDFSRVDQLVRTLPDLRERT